MFLVRRFIALAALTTIVACADDQESRPTYVNIGGLDTSCTTHDECVGVETCVCGCPESCGSSYAINRSSLPALQAERAATQCLKQQQELSCILREALCVAGTCEMRDVLPDNGEPAPPEDWDRSCTTSYDCEVVRRDNKCSLDDRCGTLDSVNRELSSRAADAWRLDCEQYTDEDCSPEGTRLPSPYCQAGRCEAVMALPIPYPDTVCHAIDNQRDCIADGCAPVVVQGWSFDNESCNETTLALCRDPENQYTFDDSNTAHVRDGFAAYLPLDQPWGFDECGASAPSCQCVPGI